MSAAFLTPKATDTVQVDGVTFTVRALRAHERFPILASSSAAGDSITIKGEQMELAVRRGLVGWDAPAPAWSANMDDNLEQLTDEAYTAIANKIIDLSFLSGDDKKNS